MSEPPALRASDDDRERAADALRRAAGDGRLDVEELEARLHDVYAARTQAELEPLVADLPAPAEPPAARLPVRRGEPGTARLVAIMSSHERTGRWRIAPRCSVVNVMGSTDLDLARAELADDVVELRVFALMGSADLRVPAGLNVDVSQLAVMGANEIDVGDERPDPGGPLVRVRLVSIMGRIGLTRSAGAP